MSTWNSRGLRGSALEELINITNDIYKDKKLGLVQKIPTPIKPVEINKEVGHITLAYFEKKSTVDFIGVIQGVPICFDAKECATDSFTLNNIHEHQMEFMKMFEDQSGVSFMVISFTNVDETYYVTYKELEAFFERAQNGGKKSFTRKELNECMLINHDGNVPLHYMAKLKIDLENRH